MFPYRLYSLSFYLAYIIRIIFNATKKYHSKIFFLSLTSLYFFKELSIYQIFFFRQFSVLKFLIIFFDLINFNSISDSLIKINDFILKYDIKFYLSLNIFTLIAVYFIYKILTLIKIKNTFISLLIVLKLNLSHTLASVNFINVGHGDAALITTAFNQATILFDTGSSYYFKRIDNFLKARSISKIDYLIISHYDEDHYGNLNNLKNIYKINNIIDKHNDIKELSILSLNKERTNKNDSSLVNYFNFNDFNFLFTGDISKGIEEEIINEYDNLKVDFLKVAHHGSRTSSSKKFLAKIEPSYAIISVGNRFNLPNDEVIKRYNDLGINLHITKNSGDLSIYFFFNYAILINSSYEFVIIRL